MQPKAQIQINFAIAVAIAVAIFLPLVAVAGYALWNEAWCPSQEYGKANTRLINKLYCHLKEWILSH